METKNNTGNLFSNDQKGNDKAPNYKGKVKVNGKDMEIAAWVKEGKNGKYLSLSFKEPFKKTAGQLPDNFRIDSKDDMPF